MENFTISTEDAAKRLGLPAHALDAFRPRLTEGSDYTNKGRRLSYSETGVKTLAGLIEPQSAVLTPPPPKTGTAVVNRTTAQGIKNPHVLEAILTVTVSKSVQRMSDGRPGTHETTSERVVVAVKNSSKYYPGQTLEVRELSHGMWEHYDPQTGLPANPPRFKK